MMSQKRFLWIVLGILLLCSVCALVSANEPPQVMITKNPTSAVVGQTITFDASGSKDPEGGALTYVWNFWDVGVQKTGPTVTFSYMAAGSHIVGLTVTDNEGAKTIGSAVITVNPLAPGEEPTANPTLPMTPALNESSTLETTPATPIPRAPVTKPTAPNGAGDNGIGASGGTGTGAIPPASPVPANTPSTGSSNTFYIIIGVMVLSLAAIFGFIVLKRR
jgi:LPXTG-motif cell wall-anchored protein